MVSWLSDVQCAMINTGISMIVYQSMGIPKMEGFISIAIPEVQLPEGKQVAHSNGTI